MAYFPVVSGYTDRAWLLNKMTHYPFALISLRCRPLSKRKTKEISHRLIMKIRWQLPCFHDYLKKKKMAILFLFLQARVDTTIMTLKRSVKKVNCFKQLRLANPGLKDNISFFIFTF